MHWTHLVSLVLCIVKFGYSQECLHRDFGNGGTVCVCTEKHCDTVPPLKQLPQGQYQLYTSSKEGSRFKKSIGVFEKEPTSTNEVDIYPNEQYQTIFGFGGAFTDAAGINIQSLNDKVQDNLMNAYFGNDGIQYSLCRVPMGGTDFSTRAYSYNDGPVDVELTKFSLSEEDYLYKIPFINKARELTDNNLKLFSSAWTAPKWMKTNNDYNGRGFLKKNMYLPWAKYFLKFLDSYKALGIDFWGITTGNEPINGVLPFIKINSVGWTAGDMAIWISDYLCPLLRNSTHSDIKLITLDDQRFFLPWFVDGIFKNKLAKDCVDGIGVHWYYDNIVPSTLLTWTHNSYPNKFILATEACIGDKPWENKVEVGSWHRGEMYAENIIEDLNAWVTGWVDWNLVLDTSGGPNYIDNFVDSPILVSEARGEFYKQPMFYVLGHFSKFIPPESIRIGSEISQKNLKTIVFKRPDNATTVIIYNKKDTSYSLSIEDPVSGFINIIIEAKSINTLVYW